MGWHSSSNIPIQQLTICSVGSLPLAKNAQHSPTSILCQHVEIEKAMQSSLAEQVLIIMLLVFLIHTPQNIDLSSHKILDSCYPQIHSYNMYIVPRPSSFKRSFSIRGRILRACRQLSEGPWHHKTSRGWRARALRLIFRCHSPHVYPTSTSRDVQA